MKKTTKRLLAFVAAMAMVLVMTSSAFAASIKLNTKTGTTNISYTAYQIFTGDLSNGKLSNVRYGTNVKAQDLFNALKGTNVASLAALKAALANKTFNANDATALAEAIAKVTSAASPYNTQEAADDLADIIAANIKDEGIALTSGSATSVPADGYYLVQGTSRSAEKNNDPRTAYSKNILVIAGTAEITPKVDVPKLEKKVKDTNDTTGVVSDWQDSADYEPGDEIPYKLTGTLPENYASYEKYSYIFTDTMTRLTYKEGSAKVYLNVEDVAANEITSHFDIAWNETDKILTVTAKDANGLKDISSVNASSKIIVRYTATLDDDAKMGSEGNPNTAKLKYSNNPNKGGEGSKGETPEDKNIVFTYKVHIDKYKNEVQTGNELPGATFTLYKEVPATTTNAQAGSAIKTGYANNVESSALDNNKSYLVIANVDADGNGATFDFQKLDDGTYVLVETGVPDGYNAWKSEKVNIEATHDETADEPTLTALTGGNLLTGDVPTGVLDGNIVNKEGSTLPATGGMGTTIFYVIGGILVLAAAIILISRRRVQQ